MNCPNCGQWLPDDSRFCAKCGVQFVPVNYDVRYAAPQPVLKKKRVLPWIIGIFLFIGVAIALSYFLFPDFYQNIFHRSSQSNNKWASDVAVPDSYLEIDLDDIYDKLSYNDDYFSNCEKEFIHDPDKENHLDNVTFKFYVDCDFGSYTQVVSAVYQYSKNTDTWERIKLKEEKHTDCHFDCEKLIGYSDSGEDSYFFTSYHYEFTIVDMDNESITFDYTIERQKDGTESVFGDVLTVPFDNTKHFQYIHLPCDEYEELDIVISYDDGVADVLMMPK